eukprot:6467262-Amphidinium_carterae.1
MVYVLECSEFSGGRLWSADKDGTSTVPQALHGRGHPTDLKGQWRSEKGQWMKLDPWRWHGVETVTSGIRISVVTFVPGYLHRVKGPVWTELGQLSFPCRTVRSLASEAGSALWRMWHLDASPERNLYASVVDGETVLWHAETLGLSRSL